MTAFYYKRIFHFGFATYYTILRMNLPKGLRIITEENENRSISSSDFDNFDRRPSAQVDVVFDRTLRDAEPLADFAVRESLQVAQREDLAALGQGGHRRVDAGAGPASRSSMIVVGIVVGVSDALDPLLMVGAVALHGGFCSRN